MPITTVPSAICAMTTTLVRIVRRFAHATSLAMGTAAAHTPASVCVTKDMPARDAKLATAISMDRRVMSTVRATQRAAATAIAPLVASAHAAGISTARPAAYVHQSSMGQRVTRTVMIAAAKACALNLAAALVMMITMESTAISIVTRRPRVRGTAFAPARGHASAPT